MRRSLPALCALIIAFSASAQGNVGSTVTGTVLETRDVDAYTYLRLKTKDGETWAAVGKAALKPGTEVTIENAMVMHDFESKTLKKTFKSIVFGNLPGTGDDMAAAHAGAAKTAAATAATTGDVRVAKAAGANAQTVGDIVARKAALKDKPVVLHAKVVKFNGGIMGKNWLHLRDGTGSAGDGSNDILATSNDVAKVGDVVLVKGTVRTDKDFGAGYTYPVMIDEASVQPSP
jgi:hypothetical protein